MSTHEVHVHSKQTYQNWQCQDLLEPLPGTEPLKMVLCMRKPTIWVSNQVRHKLANIQSQKQARSLKLWIYVQEGLYYPCSENKGTDQLLGNRKADLGLCFCLSSLLVFLCSGSIVCGLAALLKSCLSEYAWKNMGKLWFLASCEDSMES